jgi:DNA primase
MRTKKIPKYSQFVDDIEVDALEEAIGFDVLRTYKDEDIGQCPDYWGLHSNGDTTGKFAINREKMVYHCFVCEGGTLLSLAMAHLNTTDEEDATEWLYQFASDHVYTKNEFVEKFVKELEQEQERKADRIPHFNPHVLNQFSKPEDTAGQRILLEWLDERGLDLSAVSDFDIGYSSHHKKPAPMKGNEKIDDDYYGPCIVFPHFWRKTLVGWQHRWTDWDEDQTRTPKWLGKYTNTSDFPKHTTFYNYDKAIKLAKPVIVVESVPTVIYLENCFGYSAISPFGAGIKPEQLRLLRAFDQVIVAPDNDKPGRQMAEKICAYIKSAWVCPPVPGEHSDLGDTEDAPWFVEAAEAPDLLGLSDT